MLRTGRGPSPRTLAEERGQSTVEYALLLGAFLAMVCALGAIFEAAGSGAVVARAEEAASHSLGTSIVGALQDAALY